MQDTLGTIATEDLSQILTETQRKSNPHVPTVGLMYPGPLAQKHPAGSLLKEFGTTGCPVAIGDNWTLAQLDAAVAYGAHPSAENKQAAEALATETLEKVEQGQATLVKWSTLRKAIQKGYKRHTKISPIAAIPHKSRLFRMILDLSSKGQRRKTNPTPSVNELTDETAAPMESMSQLGQSLGRIIYALGSQPTDAGPIVFAKIDIKDGFWRMVVPPDQKEHFCYVLPQPNNPDAEPMIVVPDSLQMGWKSSPPFFCAATETGRDIAEWLRQQPELPPHPMEGHMMDHIDLQLPDLDSHPDPNKLREQLFHLFECFVDDYIGLVQTTDPAQLRHHSRALLHAIHQIFPPPDATGDTGEDPISYKKLVTEGEGIWATRKEILGWIFDGFHRTMQLPPKKVTKIRDTIQSILRAGHCEVKTFESFIGKCQHACMGIPGGSALLPPLYKALHAAIGTRQHQVQIHKGSLQHHALHDLRTIFKLLGDQPIECNQLIPSMPAYVGHCDACKHGVGGIWFSGSKTLRPLVWRLAWPPDIVALADSGKLTINDLEMAGLLLQYLLLEQLVPLQGVHTAVWCDNTSAVSWTSKMSSSKSVVGQQLTRILAIRFLANQSSHLAALSIPGALNDLADLASRSFKATGTKGNYDLSDSAFLTKFNSDFPLQQDKSWLLLRLHTKLTSLVCSTLRGKTQPMGSWIRLKKSASDIGHIGSTSAGPSVTWTHASPESLAQEGLTSLELLPVTCAKGMLAEDIKSALAQFRTRFAPSARPLSWKSGTIPASNQAPNGTGCDSNNK